MSRRAIPPAQPQVSRSAVPHAHRARNAPQNYDKKDMKRAGLALSGCLR